MDRKRWIHLNYDKLFNMQRSLDRHIETKHGLKNEDLMDMKILAFLVELGELANETRCFKFWSIQNPSPKEVILEEYVDGIHFILSLGITKSFEKCVPELSGNQSESIDLTNQFLIAFQSINDFKSEKSGQSYTTMFAEYLKLGQLLGFTSEDIEQSYVEKNIVNYERQQKGY